VSGGGQAAHKDDGIACKRKTQSDRIKQGTSSVRLGILVRDFAFLHAKEPGVEHVVVIFLDRSAVARECRVSWKARDTVNVRLGLVRQAPPPGGMP
jgi:hypothetical protein